jgi:hypothetical protein
MTALELDLLPAPSRDVPATEYVVQEPQPLPPLAFIPTDIIGQALTVLQKARLYEVDEADMPVLAGVVADILTVSQNHPNREYMSQTVSVEARPQLSPWSPIHEQIKAQLEYRHMMSVRGKLGSLRKQGAIPDSAIQPNGTLNLDKVRVPGQNLDAAYRNAAFLAAYGTGARRFSASTVTRIGQDIYEGQVVEAQVADEVEEGEILESVYTGVQAAFDSQGNWVTSHEYVAQVSLEPARPVRPNQTFAHTLGDVEETPEYRITNQIGSVIEDRFHDTGSSQASFLEGVKHRATTFIGRFWKSGDKQKDGQPERRPSSRAREAFG